jgi:Ti-type conjugative transfer relaxase TraA
VSVYRLSSKSISRGAGQSAVASASYRAGEKLSDERTGQTFDYTRKQNIDHTEIMIPTSANEKYGDRQTLWNAVEKAETRKNSELSKEYQLALPVEFSQAENIALVREFVKAQFVDKGLAVDMAFHNLEKGDNPHCHLMTTTRSFDKETGDLGIKERFFKDKAFLVGIRKDWEIALNEKLAEKGLEQVTADSYASRGIDLEAINTNFNGAYGQADLAQQRLERSEKLTAQPSLIANILTDKNATFTANQLQRFIDKNILSEHKEQAIQNLFKSDELITLDPKKGIFTSASYFRAEQSLLENIDKLNKADYSKSIDTGILIQTSQRLGLSEKQQEALIYATSADSQIKSIEGYAGSGKSYTIKAIKSAYEQAGYECKGIALSGIVADNLGKDAGIQDSRTIASFLYQLEQGKIELNAKTVLFLDEASLVGVKDYNRIAEAVASAGAKIISVGDDNQLQAIQAGGANRLVKENSSHYTLDEIRRQHDLGDRQATLDFSTGEQRQALEHYRDKGAIAQHATSKGLLKSMTKGYLEAEQNGKSSILLAFRKDTVSAINNYIHNELKAQGKLGKSHNINGKEFSAGDRFIFLENSNGIGVKNGTTGVIEQINDNGEMQIKADDGRTINFNANEYQKFDLAYAVTVHKSQGVSVDNAQLYFDDRMNANLALVGCTRHKESLTVHTLERNDTSEANSHGIKDFNHLVEIASRNDTKDLINDIDKRLTNHIAQTHGTQQQFKDIDQRTAQALEKSTASETQNTMEANRQAEIAKMSAEEKLKNGIITLVDYSKILDQREAEKQAQEIEKQKHNEQENNITKHAELSHSKDKERTKDYGDFEIGL